MAFATHLTLATGHDLPLGEGDETPNKNERQRVSVSITYELERGDLDVPLLATVKASELAHAHRAAAEVLRAHAFVPHAPVPPRSFTAAGSHQTGTGETLTNGADLEERRLEDANPIRLEDQDEDDLALERMDAEAPFDEDEAPFVTSGEEPRQSAGDQEPFVSSQVPTYREWIAGAGTCPPGEGPAFGQAAPPSEAAGNAGHPVVPDSPGDGPPPKDALITAPKRLAIQSLVAKLGLTSPDLTDLLRQRFGTWSLHLLTKEQGEALHRALQDRLKEKKDTALPTAFASSSPSLSSHNGRAATAAGQASR